MPSIPYINSLNEVLFVDEVFRAVGSIEIAIAISTLDKLNERKNVLLNQIPNANDLNT